MSKYLSHFSHASVGVFPLSASSGNVYVVLKDRAAFNAIAVPMVDHGLRDDGNHCLSKEVEGQGQTIIFQYWIEKP